MKKMIEPMKKKLRKYFKEISPVINCVTALNPCINASEVDHLIDKISINLDLHYKKLFFARDAKIILMSVLNIYFNKYGSTNVSTTSTFVSHSYASSMEPMFDLYHSLRQENTKLGRGDGISIANMKDILENILENMKDILEPVFYLKRRDFQNLRFRKTFHF